MQKRANASSVMTEKQILMKTTVSKQILIIFRLEWNEPLKIIHGRIKDRSQCI